VYGYISSVAHHVGRIGVLAIERLHEKANFPEYARTSGSSKGRICSRGELSYQLLLPRTSSHPLTTSHAFGDFHSILGALLTFHGGQGSVHHKISMVSQKEKSRFNCRHLGYPCLPISSAYAPSRTLAVGILNSRRNNIRRSKTSPFTMGILHLPRNGKAQQNQAQ
jgi:hypothetical protein